jgi:integrase
MSDMTITAVLRRMKRGHVTVHGFRSTFRDWVSDCTDHPRELAEAALAHIFGDETERAYRRGDALEKRRAVMNDWEDYCGSGKGSVSTQTHE